METVANNIISSLKADAITNQMPFSEDQFLLVKKAIQKELEKYQIQSNENMKFDYRKENGRFLDSFLSAKIIEGCSQKTIHYYRTIICDMLEHTQKSIPTITTDELRIYLSDVQTKRNVSKVTIDNIRRILSTFFGWLEDEDHIIKSPVRKIHKVKIMQTIKETLTDEEIEKIRECCKEPRDIALVDFFLSTGMRVGELVLLDRFDVDFQERECVVLGKGNKERKVYFDAKAKMHLTEYLNSRKDDNPALFVSLLAPFERMSISGIELRIKQIGLLAVKKRVHPHMFRRTLATMAIDKGMPIEQVQNLLGHVKIDTTLHYAMVNQENVKISHRKYIG